MFLATDFFFFSFFYYNIFYWFYVSEKKYVKVIDDYISNRKIAFKVKIEIMKRNRNCAKTDKKIWRVLECQEIVALRDFFTKSDLYNSAFESLFSQIIRNWEILFRSVGTYFSRKLLCLQRKSALLLCRKKFFIYRCVPGRKSWFFHNTWKRDTVFSKVKFK